VPAIPITATSAISALGKTTAATLERLFDGGTGLCRAGAFVAGRVDVAAIGRTTALARMALAEVSAEVARAIQRWGPTRVGLLMGTSTGGIAHSERWPRPDDYDYLRQHRFHHVADDLAAAAGILGPRYVISTACTSSAKALGSAWRLIHAGGADAVLVGGADGLCETTMQGFRALGVLADTPARPFAADRPGMSIGEGAAFLLLERAGPARAWLRGVGESSDAFRMSTPHPEGLGAERAMRLAMRHAGIGPDEVDYINAHGTGTRANDAAEAAAIGRVFGQGAAVGSTKGATGHTLGACGALEAVFCVAAIEAKCVPPSAGSSPLDPACAMDIVQVARPQPVRIALSNACAFGGNNVCIALGTAA
jgi:3-oxoacyl-[acyl-carrier-protein] synthase-1